MRPIVIVPAAGKSQRFLDAGIVTPKPLLQLRYQGNRLTMVEHAVNGVPDDWPIRVVVKEEHEAEFARVLPKNTRLQLFSIEKTMGQADTVVQGLHGLERDQPVLVLNSDGVVHYDWRALAAQVHPREWGAAAIVMRAIRRSYSYVVGFPTFRSAVEKPDSLPTMPMALVGAYYFPRADTLEAAAWDDQVKQEREFYMSHLLTEVPGDKLAVAIPPECYVDFGTPEAATPYLT